MNFDFYLLLMLHVLELLFDFAWFLCHELHQCIVVLLSRICYNEVSCECQRLNAYLVTIE